MSYLTNSFTMSIIIENKNRKYLLVVVVVVVVDVDVVVVVVVVVDVVVVIVEVVRFNEIRAIKIMLAIPAAKRNPRNNETNAHGTEHKQW